MGKLPGRLGTLTARDIMTDKIVVLSEDDTLAHAAQVLIEHHISGAPVVSEGGKFVGLLSLSDIAQPKASEGGERSRSDAIPDARDSDATWAWLRYYDGEHVQTERVRDHMSRQLISVSVDASLLEVARTMCDGHWHRLVVVDELDFICGIVSTMDVLAALVNTAAEEKVLDQPEF